MCIRDRGRSEPCRRAPARRGGPRPRRRHAAVPPPRPGRCRTRLPCWPEGHLAGGARRRRHSRRARGRQGRPSGGPGSPGRASNIRRRAIDASRGPRRGSAPPCRARCSGRTRPATWRWRRPVPRPQGHRHPTRVRATINLGQRRRRPARRADRAWWDHAHRRGRGPPWPGVAQGEPLRARTRRGSCR